MLSLNAVLFQGRRSSHYGNPVKMCKVKWILSDEQVFVEQVHFLGKTIEKQSYTGIQILPQEPVPVRMQQLLLILMVQATTHACNQLP